MIYLQFHLGGCKPSLGNMSDSMADKKITCQDCGEEFVFSEDEQVFYAEKGFSDPKRCKPCREKKKAQRRRPRY